MEVRYTTGRNEYRRMTTDELRAAFMNTKLCEKGKVNLMYCEVERGIAGFAVPTAKPLSLDLPEGWTSCRVLVQGDQVLPEAAAQDRPIPVDPCSVTLAVRAD